MTRKLSALSRVSSLAIAASLTATAAGQSLLGTPTVTFGSANITEGTGTTDVDVFSSSAVIDWTPDDNLIGNFGAIAFQNSGTTATFRGFEGDYAVLNRINVADNSRKIFMNGTVQSFINQSVGGDIFFYSPSGFVIGANAVINVGSLVLSASPITVDANGGFISNGLVTFAQADPSASITTVAGSQINALAEGSYVALVAPRVEHNGAIAVNGAAALVGAEAATINFRTDGLFDITVNLGTTDANGVVVGGTGSITGPASGGAGDNHRAYLVAVPKNTAMTMLISSGAELGFDVAGAADVQGNAVILSAGHDVAFGSIVGSPSFASGADADMSIGNANFTSAVDGRANGDLTASSVGGSLAFASDASLAARDLVKLEAGGGGNVSVGGNLTLNARASGENQGESAQAGNVTLQAFAGGQLSVTGDTVLTAIGSGGFSSTPGVASGDGRGGTILVQATSGGDMFLGNVDSSGSLDADASGFGGGFFGDIDGGDGIGGTVNVFASGDGTLTVAGATFLRAEGWGGGPSDCFQCGLNGGIGDAGTINVQAHSGAASKLDFRDVLFVFSDGHGGDGQVGGLGLGGNVVLSATGGARVDVASDVSIAASGTGGNARGGAGNGGDGVGGGTGAGIVVGLAEGGTLALNGNVGIIVEGTGGQSDGGTGGTGTGGEGRLLANAAGTITVAGAAAIDASGMGGAGVIGGAGIGGSPTNGGGAFFNGNGGTLTITGLAGLTAGGQGGTGSGGAGGNATGGRTGAGAFGGTAHFMNNLYMDASATGGAGDVGGNATALTSDPEDELAATAVALFAQNGGTTTVDGTTVLSAEAVGGNGANGNGGNAQAGEVDAFGYVGNMSLQSLAIDVNGYGGDGGNGGAGGAGNGGVVDLTFGFEEAPIGGTITLASAVITADGEGGDGGAGIDGTSGGNGGAGGAGTGGDILFAGSAAGGTINSGFALVTAYGRGGNGGSGGAGSTGLGGNGGAGGTGTGGAIQTGTISSELAPTTGGGASYTTLSADSSAFGGTGGDGGTGVGGNGAGGNGGNALGGRATFLARGVLVTADSVTLTANANGGDGGGGSAQGNGGNARTGVIAVESKDRFNHADQRGTLEVDTIMGSAIAVGGIGATDGTSSAIGSSFFRVANGDATIGSVDLNIAGSTYDNSFISSMVSVRDGTATITGDFSFTTTGQLVLDASLGSMTAGTINLGAGTFVPYTFNPPQAGPGSYSADSFAITTGGDFITNANLDSGSALSIVAPGLIDAVDIDVAGNLTLHALNGTLDAGNITNAGHADFEATDSVTLLDLDVGSAHIDSTNGGIAIGNVLAAGDLEMRAFNGAITAGDLDLEGWLIANGDSILIGNAIVDGLQATFNASSSIETGDIAAFDDVTMNSSGSILAGNIGSGGDVQLTAFDAIGAGAINAAGFIGIESANSGVSVGNLTALTSIDLDAFGAITFGNVSADDFNFISGGAVSGGNIVATTHADGEAEGAIVVGDVTVSGPPIEDDFSVGFVSATSIQAGNVDGFGSVGFATFGNVTTGNLNAGNLVMTLASGDIATGSITTTQPNGQVYMADSSMFTENGGPDDFIVSDVLSEPPVPTGGSITIGGPVSTSLFRAAAGSDFTAGNINADSIFTKAGGTATVNGLWSALDVELWSNDIDIDAEGGIDAGASGSVRLVSTNGTQALIGDGLNGSGYQLSNSEFGRLNSGSVEIAARGDASAPIDMLIGDLSITGPLAGSTVNDPNGHVAFATGDLLTQTASGVIRITGEVTATGFQDTNSLEFYTGRFELDAATGSISITSSGGALSGELGLYADQIHVAEGSILDQLAVDPQYAGYQEDLNAPAAVQRPEGVLNAATIWIESDNLQNVLIQNTGTTETPAGFLAQETFVNDDFEIAGPPGSIDLVVNGQLQTEGGVLTGIAVRDASVEGADLNPFTANSTINGCLLAGACVQTPDNPFPPDFTPTPGIQQEIVLLGDDPMPPPPFGNEDVIDDNDEETEDNSPIVPPQPLFDTSELGEAEGTGNPAFNTPMRSHPGLLEKGDVDDPVSGGGNPGLMAVPPTDTQEKQP